MVLSPWQIEEVRMSICLATPGGERPVDKGENEQAKQGEGNVHAAEYDLTKDLFLKTQRHGVGSQNANVKDSNHNFNDSDEENEAYLLEMIRLLRTIQQGIRAPDLVSAACRGEKNIATAKKESALGSEGKAVEAEELGQDAQHALHLEKSPAFKTEAAEVESLDQHPVIEAGKPTSVSGAEDSVGATKKHTQEPALPLCRKVLDKLSHAEVWGVPRTWFRLEKVKGLEDLKDTPFLVRLILGILHRLNEMAASPSTVKQNLLLVCSEDEAEMAASRLQRANITSTSKKLEAFQRRLGKVEGVCMKELEKVADAVQQDLKLKKDDKLEKDGKPMRQEKAFDRDRFVRILLSALRQRSLSRSVIYSVFTGMYIEAKVHDKQASASTSLTPAKLQQEAALFCERLAMVMTRESTPKVEYAITSVVFTDSTDPFFEFFANSSSDASVLELVQRCCPLTISQGVCSFLHKSIQEYFAALRILKHLAALCGSCRSNGKDILHVLDLLALLDTTTSSDVRIPAGLDSKEKEEHMMRVVEKTSWGKGCKVADRTRMSQDLLKLVLGTNNSALCKLDIEQEEGVRDFLVDMQLSSPSYQNALIIIARLCASRIGTFAMARENIWTVLTMANPKREGGSLLHVACREGNLPLLRTALAIMKDSYRERLWHVSTPGAKWENVGLETPKTGTEIKHEALAAALMRQAEFTEEELDAMKVRNVVKDESYIKVGGMYIKTVASYVPPLLLRGKSKFRTIPIIAAALHGHRDCVEEILQFVEGLQQAPVIEEWKRHVYTLEWRNYRLDDADAQMVAQVLECLPGLCKLDLSGNSIGAPGCQFLGKKLTFAKSLQHLNMSENPIGAEGCQFLVKPQEVGKLQEVAEKMAVDMSIPGLIKDEFYTEFMEDEDYRSVFGKSCKLSELIDVIWGHYCAPRSQDKKESDLVEHMYGYILETLKCGFKEEMSKIVPQTEEEKKMRATFHIEQEEMRTTFKAFDTSSDDAISETEFLAFFRQKFGSDDLDHLAKEAQVTVEKLLQKLKILPVDGDDGNQTNTARMTNAFRGLDRNNNGVLSLQEFVPLLEAIITIAEEETEEQALEGLACAVSLQELNLSGCGIGPEGSRAVAAVLHRFSALTRLHIHDEVGVKVWATTTLAADGPVVVQGCLVPRVDAEGGEEEVLELNLLRLHTYVQSQLALCNQSERANTPEVQDDESRLEQAFSMSYCAAKAAAGVFIDLLQELSDATEACPGSSKLRELKTLVSRSRAFIHSNPLYTRTGRETARAFLQVAYQEPMATGLPARVEAITWDDLGKNVPGRDRSLSQSMLIERINRPEQRPDACILTVSEHKDKVNGVKMLAGGKLLVSVSDDGDVLICSAKTGEVKCTLAGHNAEGRHGCICGSEDICSGIANEDCPLLATGGHVGGVTCVDVSQNGKLLVTGGEDRTVRVWKRNSRSGLFTLWKQSSAEQHTGRVTCVSISRNGRTIASGSDDKSVKLWETSSDGALKCQRTMRGHSDR